MDLNNTKKDSGFRGIFWFVFSAAATFCAFTLPAFIALLINKNPVPDFLFIFLTVFVIIASLYHSLYRIKASDTDLKLINLLIVWISVVTFIIAIIQNV